jgi:hypothetical protein
MSTCIAYVYEFKVKKYAIYCGTGLPIWLTNSVKFQAKRITTFLVIVFGL